jgi:hypothetical protein
MAKASEKCHDVATQQLQCDQEASRLGRLPQLELGIPQGGLFQKQPLTDAMVQSSVFPFRFTEGALSFFLPRANFSQSSAFADIREIPYFLWGLEVEIGPPP